MIAQDSIEIFNLYTLLPGYGESFIELLYDNNKLLLTVGYDGDVINNQTSKFIFERCVSFEFASFPGISMYNNLRNHNINLGSLIEFQNSEYANEWDKHFNYKIKTIRHYSIIFLSENKQLNILAESVLID
jgi:hypothetical protein